METCLGNIRGCIKIMLMVFDSNMFKMYMYKEQSNLLKNEKVTAVVHELLGINSDHFLKKIADQRCVPGTILVGPRSNQTAS